MKPVVRCALCLVSLLVVGCAAPAQAGPRETYAAYLPVVYSPAGAIHLINPGFEAGDLSGWTTSTWVTSTTAYTGTYSASITNAAGTLESDPYEVSPGDSYQLSCHTRTPVLTSDGRVTVQLRWLDSSRSTVALSGYAYYGSVPTDYWSVCAWTARAPMNATYLTVLATAQPAPGGSLSTYLDDVSVQWLGPLACQSSRAR